MNPPVSFDEIKELDSFKKKSLDEKAEVVRQFGLATGESEADSLLGGQAFKFDTLSRTGEEFLRDSRRARVDAIGEFMSSRDEEAFTNNLIQASQQEQQATQEEVAKRFSNYLRFRDINDPRSDDGDQAGLFGSVKALGERAIVNVATGGDFQEDFEAAEAELAELIPNSERETLVQLHRDKVLGQFEGPAKVSVDGSITIKPEVFGQTDEQIASIVNRLNAPQEVKDRFLNEEFPEQLGKFSERFVDTLSKGGIGEGLDVSLLRRVEGEDDSAFTRRALRTISEGGNVGKTLNSILGSGQTLVGGLASSLGADRVGRSFRDRGRANLAISRLTPGSQTLADVAGALPSLIPAGKGAQIGARAAGFFKLSERGAAIARGAGVAIGAGLTSGVSTFGDSLDQRRTREEARGDALRSAVATGLLTGGFGVAGAGGAERVFTGVAREKIRRGIVQNIINLGKQGIFEGIEESADEIAQHVFVELERNPNANIEDLVDNAIKAFQVAAILGTSINAANDTSQALGRVIDDITNIDSVLANDVGTSEPVATETETPTAPAAPTEEATQPAQPAQPSVQTQVAQRVRELTGSQSLQEIAEDGGRADLQSSPEELEASLRASGQQTINNETEPENEGDVEQVLDNPELRTDNAGEQTGEARAGVEEGEGQGQGGVTEGQDGARISDEDTVTQERDQGVEENSTVEEGTTTNETDESADGQEAVEGVAEAPAIQASDTTPGLEGVSSVGGIRSELGEVDGIREEQTVNESTNRSTTDEGAGETQASQGSEGNPEVVSQVQESQSGIQRPSVPSTTDSQVNEQTTSNSDSNGSNPSTDSDGNGGSPVGGQDPSRGTNSSSQQGTDGENGTSQGEVESANSTSIQEGDSTQAAPQSTSQTDQQSTSQETSSTTPAQAGAEGQVAGQLSEGSNPSTLSPSQGFTRASAFLNKSADQVTAADLDTLIQERQDAPQGSNEAIQRELFESARAELEGQPEGTTPEVRLYSLGFADPKFLIDTAQQIFTAGKNLASFTAEFVGRVGEVARPIAKRVFDDLVEFTKDKAFDTFEKFLDATGSRTFVVPNSGRGSGPNIPPIRQQETSKLLAI